MCPLVAQRVCVFGEDRRIDKLSLSFMWLLVEENYAPRVLLKESCLKWFIYNWT